MPHQRIYNNNPVFCITISKLVDCGVSEDTIRSGIKRDKKNNQNNWPYHKEGNDIFLHYYQLSDKYRLLIDNYYCNGKPAEQFTASKNFIENLIPSEKDRKTLNDYHYTDGTPIVPAKLPDLYKKCAILNLVNIANPKIAAQYGCKNMPDFWKFLLEQIRNTGIQMPNKSYYSLKKKALEYRKDGAEVVIDGRTGNNNAQMVTPLVERLLLNLFAKDNKPYYIKVHQQYINIITGKATLTDMQTGEIFNPADFVDSKGRKLMISRSTVYNWIMKPYNRRAVDKVRLSGLDNSAKHRPHVRRHAPEFALSKITMDDIDVPFKMPDGSRVKAYQIFDCASGAVIGAAFSKDKNRDLFVDALRNMFTNIIVNGWKMPGEIEVEQHISNTFKDDLLKAKELFPFVTWCRGGNPQEKRAEGFIRRKKYSVQNDRLGFQRRPFGINESNRLNEDKNKTRYSYQEIIDNEWKDIATYNNQLPTDKFISKKYPGLTRDQILRNHQNPVLNNPDHHIVAWYVGHKSEAMIQRGSYVMYKDEKYLLPNPYVLKSLNNNPIIKSYIDTGDTIDKLYLYQDGKFICECSLDITFNESKVERTQEDIDIMRKQQQDIARYDHMVATRRDWAQELRVELETEAEEVAEVAEVTEVETKPNEIKTKEPDLSDMSVEERLLVEKFGNSSFRKY